MGHVFYGGEIGRGVIGPNPAFVVTEDHVHDPVQAVLDRPMATHHGSEEMRRHHQRRYIKPRLLFLFAGYFTRAFNHDDSVQPRPIVTFSQSLGIVYDGGGSGFDAAMIRINRGRLTDL